LLGSLIKWAMSIVVRGCSLINAGSLKTEAHWGWSTITLTLHIGVGSLDCELSIFFFQKKNQFFLFYSWFSLKSKHISWEKNDNFGGSAKKKHKKKSSIIKTNQ